MSPLMSFSFSFLFQKIPSQVRRYPQPYHHQATPLLNLPYLKVSFSSFSSSFPQSSLGPSQPSLLFHLFPRRLFPQHHHQEPSFFSSFSFPKKDQNLLLLPPLWIIFYKL